MCKSPRRAFGTGKTFYKCSVVLLLAVRSNFSEVSKSDTIDDPDVFRVRVRSAGRRHLKATFSQFHLILSPSGYMVWESLKMRTESFTGIQLQNKIANLNLLE